MTEKTMHVRIALTLNEDSWGYQEPRVQKELSFSIPEDMFHSPLLTKKVEALVKELGKDFEARVKELADAEKSDGE